MGSEKLKGCPFCNGPAVNVAGEYVTCGSPTFLDCAGRSVKAEPAAWNTRAPADLRSALEAETIERCAKVAEDFEGRGALERCDDPTGAIANEIADLIRALIPTKEDAS